MRALSVAEKVGIAALLVAVLGLPAMWLAVPEVHDVFLLPGRSRHERVPPGVGLSPAESNTISLAQEDAGVLSRLKRLLRWSDNSTKGGFSDSTPMADVEEFRVLLIGCQYSKGSMTCVAAVNNRASNDRELELICRGSFIVDAFGHDHYANNCQLGNESNDYFVHIFVMVPNTWYRLTVSVGTGEPNNQVSILSYRLRSAFKEFAVRFRHIEPLTQGVDMLPTR